MEIRRKTKPTTPDLFKLAKVICSVWRPVKRHDTREVRLLISIFIYGQKHELVPSTYEPHIIKEIWKIAIRNEDKPPDNM